MAPTNATPVASGTDSDGAYYLERDITFVERRKSRVKLSLLPLNCRILAKPPDGYIGEPIFFERKNVDFICRHRSIKSTDKVTGIVTYEKQCKAIINWGGGTGCSIQSLRNHASGASHWTAPAKAAKSRSESDRNISSFFTKKSKNKSKDGADKASAEESDSGKNDENQQEADKNTGKSDEQSSNNKSPSTSIQLKSPPVGTAASASSSSNAVINVENEVGTQEFTTYQCNGMHYYRDFPNIKYPPSYDFGLDYPFSIHSQTVCGLFQDSIRHTKPSWTVTVDGIITSVSCGKTFIVENTAFDTIAKSKAGGIVCSNCANLAHSQPLLKTLRVSASKGYDESTPKSLLPFSVMARDYESLKSRNDLLTWERLNDKRKLVRLTERRNDHERFVTIVSESNTPYMGELLATHLRQGRGLDAFTEKLEKAETYREGRYGSWKRGLIQRRHRPGKHNKLAGDFNEDYQFLRKVDLSYVVLKLGGRRLAKTHNVASGGFSARHTQRLIQSGVIPVFKVVMSPNCIDAGRIAIRKNMEAIGGGAYKNFLPKHKVMVVCMIDGISIDERVGVDTSVMPNVWTGLCRHGRRSNVCNTWDDGVLLQNDLRNGNVHLASEVEVACLGLIDKDVTSLMPVALSPTCKADDEPDETTHTVHFLLSAIEHDWYDLELDKTIGPLCSWISDGAPGFRKGASMLTSDRLPPFICDTLADAPFFNFVGSRRGTTPGCDLNHVGKRNRARGKSAKGSRVGNFTFNKVELARLFRISSVVKDSKQAVSPLNPDDNMDVKEMVRYLQAVRGITAKSYDEFPQRFRDEQGSRERYLATELYGEITGSLAALIIGHKGALEEEGKHMSVEDLLKTASKLSFLLFFLFRKHKSDLFPNQHYRNVQDTVKNIYCCVTLSKHHKIYDFIWFLNTSQRLEQLFGIVRSMEGGNLNFDSLGLQQRVGEAATISQIYARHPEWDSPPRKLTCTLDRKNCRSWKGDTNIKHVGVLHCWNHGLNAALACLRKSGIFTEAELSVNLIKQNEPGADILKPYRKTIGVHAGDTTHIDLVVEDDAEDDNYGDEQGNGLQLHGVYYHM